jgi:beta-galactosidase
VACGKFCELLHLRGAEALATYAHGFFAGRAAVTRNRYGAGEAFYVATEPDRTWLAGVLDNLLQAHAVLAPVTVAPGVEAVVRVGAGKEFLFLINHQPVAAAVELGSWAGQDLLSNRACAGAMMLEPFGVHVLARTIA